MKWKQRCVARSARQHECQAKSEKILGQLKHSLSLRLTSAYVGRTARHAHGAGGDGP